MDKSVGATLREARNRRKVDLSEVEAATKIRVRYLRAIENEEWQLLPEDAYARAFIRTYASYLGLDAERLAEEHRRGSGATRPAERLPRVDPAPPPRSRRRVPRPPPRVLAVLVSLLLVAALVAVGLSSGGGSSSPVPREGRHGHGTADRRQPRKPAARNARGLSLRLTATADVWVCLLGGKGESLLDGKILGAGSAAGPFRSGSFTLSLGNGEVSMTVNGQQASIPATSSPIGYAVDRTGALRRLSESERPTCT